jgi:hypothetical protein
MCQLNNVLKLLVLISQKTVHFQCETQVLMFRKVTVVHFERH